MNLLFKILFCFAVVFGLNTNVMAQKSDKELKKELKSKALKDFRKEAKAKEKEGWRVMPGATPLEKQIQESQIAMIDEDEEGNALNITASHIAKGGNFSAAKKIAQHRARTELVNNLNNQITDIVKEKISNADLGDNDIEVIDEFLSSNKGISSVVLQDIDVVYEVFREDSDFVEVEVVVSTNREKAFNAVRNKFRENLKDSTQEISDELDEIMSF